jgi:NAD+ synthase (glutamine-hydrolysing)
MRRKLNGLRISLNQMPVIPGRPDLNTKYILNSIKEAASNNVDILAFPEMCISGYVIGDLYEDDCFVQEIIRCNKIIIDSVPANLTVIFGTLIYDEKRKNEDGRLRKYNTALIATDGNILKAVSKTLQPNYRIFDDDRHFFSTRKFAAENNNDLENYFSPITLNTRIGSINLGVILCEDMWHKDYAANPTKSLVESGAQIIFNLSASPWTWQKNRKRHQVVHELLTISPVPFVYVNNTGTQNNGKNIIVFDGSSTVYNESGEIMLAVPAYQEGNHDFIFSSLSSKNIQPLVEESFDNLESKIKHDADELFAGWQCAIKGAFSALPVSMRKAVIGLSGGIDSAVDAVVLAHILGPENVYAINMPSHYNSQKTKNIAQEIANNLGINYEIRPINEIVSAICSATGTEVDSLSYENIQARVRQEILAARCQDLGAVFICNSNKIEMAFGYGTLYGDIAGFLAPLGDMLKYEVYQMGDYLNRVIYKKEVIPAECFTIAPSAELKDAQTDPFHYGSLKSRGYHDELVRAFIEFRCNPEVILDKYLNHTLEQELKLESGVLKKLFGTTAEFIDDLEKNYSRLINSYFKRVQCPPIPILSRRSFGYDLRESLLSPFFTSRYYDLKKIALSRKESKTRIALWGGSFNPAGRHHQEIADRLSKEFDHVFIIPCGNTRPDKALVSNNDRAIIANIAFGSFSNTELDHYDLIHNVYTPTYLLEERYTTKYPDAEIWHVIGSDLIIGGSEGNSQIQKNWVNGLEVWQNLKFCIISRPGYPLTGKDMPPNHYINLLSSEIFGSSTEIREKLKNNLDVSNLIDDSVLTYIKDHKLYI